MKVDGQQAALTPKEIDLLIFLASHPNVALSRQRLLEEVWNYDYYGDDRTVDTHIKKLRKSLGKASYHIETVIKAGYVWK